MNKNINLTIEDLVKKLSPEARTILMSIRKRRQDPEYSKKTTVMVIERKPSKEGISIFSR